MTATGSHGNFDALRGAPPFTQGSRGCSRTSAFIDVSQKDQRIVPHSYHIRLFAMTWFFNRLPNPFSANAERGFVLFSQESSAFPARIQWDRALTQAGSFRIICVAKYEKYDLWK